MIESRNKARYVDGGRVMTLGRLFGIACGGLLLISPLFAQQPRCPHPSGWKPSDEELQKILSAHKKWVDGDGNIDGRAILCNAVLVKKNLEKQDLRFANLEKADLSNAKLDNADLSFSNLDGARLTDASIANSILAYTRMWDAVYAPRSQAPNLHVAGIDGLESVTFPDGRQDGLVQLRELLQKAGHRDLERAVTYAIEKGNTKYEFENWSNNLVGLADAIFRVVAFDWTTGYGLYPAWAMQLVMILWAIMILPYLVTIWRREPPNPDQNRSGIFRILPKDRIDTSVNPPAIQSQMSIERLSARGRAAFGWAAYFSLLSTFQIGYKEFSIGAWLSRVQPGNFALEATGWVRAISGLQSLVSVYLLAMWLLTYFGRPFQ